jgi:hypothetical protein
MIGRAPFGPAELSMEVGAPSAELAAAVRLGRELDALALAATVEVGRDFGSRIMAVLAAEPAPAPVAAVGRALATGRPIAALAGLRDAWRVALGGGRPALVRVQAFALVLLALLAFGSVGTLAGAATLGALERRGAPAPLVPLTAPPPVATPTSSPKPTATAEPTQTIEPPESPSQAPALGPTPPVTPGHSARPTPEPRETPQASETPEPSDDGSGHGGIETPDPTDTSGPGG